MGISAVMLLAAVVGGSPQDYPIYRNPTRASYRRTCPRYPVAVYWWTWPAYHRYENRPRLVPPGHRRYRLAWEGIAWTEVGRRGLLLAAMRAMMMRRELRSESLSEYKVRTRANDPAWRAGNR